MYMHGHACSQPYNRHKKNIKQCELKGTKLHCGQYRKLMTIINLVKMPLIESRLLIWP